MKTRIIKQEILLIVTPFSKKEFCERSASNSPQQQSPAEELEQACWNGLLDELLGNLIEKTAWGKRLCLWHIQQRKAYLAIELCDSPQCTERHLSIIPYSFLPRALQN